MEANGNNVDLNIVPGNQNNKFGDQQQPRMTKQCQRCRSQDTKFCYYNNYSLNQPRHYCRTCKRHWTEGGAIRDVPVGGNRRGNRRARAAPYLNAPAARGRGRAVGRGGAMMMSGGRSMAVAGRGHGRIVSSNSIAAANYPNPFETRFSAYRSTISSFAPMPLLSGGGAWQQQERLLMSSSIPNDRMFLWGLDGGASGSGPSGGSGIGGLPALDDIDAISNNQWVDLLENNPPPLPPSSA
ncbi:unnamed protein product [Rhodiola kirilowii]